MGERLDGKWAAPRVGISVPRQNGKNGFVEMRELGGLLLFGERILHTAHEVKTAMMAFRRIRAYFENYDDLRKMVRKISNTNGQEAIWLSNGASLQFAARSKSSGRGFSVDTLILDEAQELSDETWAAIFPTLSASPNAQTILLGTPPSENMNGEVFTRFRENGLAGEDDRLVWLEWSAEEEDDFSDPEVWAKANPALGIRLDVETIRDEYASMDEATFCRERLGMWDGTASLQVIPHDEWTALASQTDPTGKVAFAIDVSPDRQRASIGVAGYIEGERVMVQAIENRKGTGWVVQRLKELTERWPYTVVVLDSGGAAAALLPEIKRAKIRRVEVIGTSEVKQACGLFYDLAMGSPGGTDSDGREVPPSPPRLAHPDQPVLNEALASARKRPLGDAWAWNRKDPLNDITPLVAVTFAAFGLSMKRTSARGPQKVVVL